MALPTDIQLPRHHSQQLKSQEEALTPPTLATASPAKRARNMLIALCLLLVFVYLVVRSANHPEGAINLVARSYLARPHNSSDYPGDYYHEDLCTLHDPFEDALPAIRTKFGGLATIVYGWPSTGGVWVHEMCNGVELDFLGLDRFNISATQRKSDPDAEDAFCRRLEYIGGHFWETEYEYNKQQWQYEQPHTLWTGWPGAVPQGGVWALWTGDYEGAELGVGRIRNALSMEERCKAIERLGGRFFESWDDVLSSKPAAAKGDLDEL